MRGDPPGSKVPTAEANLSTPHARGSTRCPTCGRKMDKVYPACAGIHLTYAGHWIDARGLPRMRGDPPLFSHSSLWKS